MADSEDDSISVCDKKQKGILTTPNHKSKAEDNASNNSSAVKKNQSQSSTSVKIGLDKKSTTLMQSQTARRAELLDKYREKAYVYDEHTQTFLNFLVKNNVDVRDVKSKVFKNQLMLYETMDEVPAIFAKNWLMYVCPVGSRCLVVARQGYTGAYTKTGYHIISHPSNLPMGNKMLQGFGACILDCIYCNETETYYVLDLMCWNGQPFYENTTQTRLKFLQEKVWDYELNHPSQMNPYPFVPLKTFTPTKSNIRSAVIAAPFHIDGLLFIYKHATYTPGSSPVVLWLTLEHLPSKLKVEIPEMGIVTAVNYKDPVALALAHGVSPAIISQVYPPSARGYSVTSYSRDRQNQINHEASRFSYQFGQECQLLDQSLADYNQTHHSYTFRRTNTQMKDNLAFLPDMMMNCKIQPGRQRPYSQHENHMPASGEPYFYNNNANNNNTFSPPKDYGERDTLLQGYTQDSRKQKKKKGQIFRHAMDVQSNWEEPHGVMKSQWMVKKPDNFESDYLICICPVAKRRIMVAAKGFTCIFNKYGKLLDCLSSSLPHGHSASDVHSKRGNDLIILDCLWSGSSQKFYVIDVLHWRQHTLYNSEAEFRFFWLTDLLSDVIVMSDKKEITVEVLPKHACSKESILSALSKADYKVDGLLFFAKTGLYSLESCSNALWLKVDMMEEMLGYSCPHNVNYKASTEKERKQRSHYIHINNA